MIILGLFTLILFTAGLRGSIGRRPVQLKDAAITADDLLNKVVINPYMALFYAVDRHLKLLRSSGLKAYLPDGDIVAAAQPVTGISAVFSNLDDYFVRAARGPKSETPRHIFLIVGESYSAWPLLDKFAPLGLAEGVRQLTREGISIKRFLPASTGTMTSLATLITGLPDAGIPVNYQRTSRHVYPSSLPSIFKRLGYRSRFFYGGFLSWQRLGIFCRDQGFEEIYGGGHMGDWITSNEWGVNDEYLFEFALKTVKDEMPSFNVILTTSFHPPYNVDVRGMGYRLNEIPDALKSDCIEAIEFNMLGHFWYADRCIADFTARVEERLPATLIAVTGDHAGRRPIARSPDLFEKHAVPFVLHGPMISKDLAGEQSAAGSHLDVGATLIELVAPAGFRYHALGRDLLLPSAGHFGISQHQIIGPNFFAELRGAPRIYPLPEDGRPIESPPIGYLLKLHNSYLGLAWWRIVKGAEIR